ncbi:hypothetical protein JYT87_03675 [Nitrospira defluvii]|nr:hypothetical protein [Nitrospira defluvii]
MRRSVTTFLIDSFRVFLRYIGKSNDCILVLSTLLLLSGCGGSGSGSGNNGLTVDLIVNLFDKVIINAAPSGQSVRIVDGGEVDFTCPQSLSDQLGADARCSTIAPGSNLESSGIVLGSLPTDRIYTLTHIDDGGNTGATCQVEIKTTTTLEAQTPCASDNTSNSITMTLNSGFNP